MKPKTASTLAYLGQTLLQSLHLAQDEYINAFGTNHWRDTIRAAHEQTADHFADHTSPDPESTEREPEPEPDPAATPAAASDAPPNSPPAPTSEQAPAQQQGVSPAAE